MIRIVAACIAGSVAAIAAAQEHPVDLSGDGPRGRLKLVVKPEYPPEALARGQTGMVRVEGVARPDGYVDDYRYSPDKPESSVFVDALKVVTRDWVFVPAYRSDCRPSDAPIAVEVSFEIDNGSPRIFVTHEGPANAGTPLAHFKPVKRRNPRYPEDMLRRGVMADVFTRVVVDRSGHVTEVTAHAYASYPKTASMGAFTTNVERALRDWEFPPVPEGAQAPWTGCYTVSYRIR